MSAPLLWIALPALFALILFLIRRLESAVIVAGALVALLLALSAWRLAIDIPISLGPLSIKLSDTLVVLGRRFILTDQDRPLLAFIFSVSAVWFAGAYFARPGTLFVPVGLGIVALLTASIAVNPFLFAALFIAIAVLLSIPLLVPPGRRAGSGALLYLTYQLLGVPFILFTGWMLAGVDASPGDQELVLRASILLGFGFALLLGVVPFHSWIPMIAEQSHPYVASFLFVVLLGLISFFGLGFLDRFVWLRESDVVYDILRYAGLLMVVVGGVWVAFEKNLARALAYTVIIDGGLSLLALSLAGQLSTSLFFGLLPARVVGFLVWSVALTAQKALFGDTSVGTLRRGFWETPLLMAALLTAVFNFAALPLLAGFPTRLSLWDALARESIATAILATVGSLGLFVVAFRTIQAASQPSENPDEILPLSPGVSAFFILGILLLVFFGLYPQGLDFIATNLSAAFPNLSGPN